MKYLKRFNEEISSDFIWNKLIKAEIERRIDLAEKEKGGDISGEEKFEIWDDVENTPKFKKIIDQLNDRERNKFDNISKVLKDYYTSGEITDKNGNTKKVTKQELDQIVSQMTTDGEKEITDKAEQDRLAKEAAKPELQRKLENIGIIKGYWYVEDENLEGEGIYNCDLKFSKYDNEKSIIHFSLDQDSDAELKLNVLDDGKLSSLNIVSVIQSVIIDCSDDFRWVKDNEEMESLFLGFDVEGSKKLKLALGLKPNDKLSINGKVVGIAGKDFDKTDKSSDLKFFKRQPYVLKETDVKEKLETTTESNTNGKIKSFLKFNKLK
jgi:hypothetical protein